MLRLRLALLVLASAVCVVGLLPPPPAAAAVGADGWVSPLPGRPLRVHAPFDPPPERWHAGHRGVDLTGAEDALVVAAGSGRVAFAGMVAGRPVVSVDHGHGLRTTYEPVVPAVRAGQRVRVGEALGVLSRGASHCRPMVCLHWGLREGDRYLDPLTLLGLGPPRLLPLGPHHLRGPGPPARPAPPSTTGAVPPTAVLGVWRGVRAAASAGTAAARWW